MDDMISMYTVVYPNNFWSSVLQKFDEYKLNKLSTIFELQNCAQVNKINMSQLIILYELKMWYDQLIVIPSFNNAINKIIMIKDNTDDKIYHVPYLNLDIETNGYVIKSCLEFNSETMDKITKILNKLNILFQMIRYNFKYTISRDLKEIIFDSQKKSLKYYKELKTPTYAQEQLEDIKNKENNND